MKKLRLFALAALVAVLAFSLFACAPSFEYDKDEAKNRAEEVVSVLVTGDYDAIVGLFREDLRTLTTPEEFKNAWDPYLTKAGAFTEIKSIDSAGQTDKSGAQYIAAAAVCKYENATHTYTIVFDMDYNVTGLYMK